VTHEHGTRGGCELLTSTGAEGHVVPMTHHVECIALFTPQSSASSVD